VNELTKSRLIYVSLCAYFLACFHLRGGFGMSDGGGL
jgi:hypothetical protein